MVRTKTNEEFQKQFYDKFGKCEYELISDYIGCDKPVKIRHKCGYEFEKKPKNILPDKMNLHCPICHADKYPSNVIIGLNDMATTNPEIASLLKYSEDAKKYRVNTNKKLYFICPICGNEIYKTGNEVYRNGLQCTKCSDGFSYAEKFMKSILDQLNINYIQEYSPCWLKPYKYDFYFEKNNKKYIVEMDGGLGHGNFTIDGDIDIKGKSHDDYKDSLAIVHNLEVIRIDCNYINISNRYEYIKNNILNSKLSTIIDLSKINLSLCCIYSEKSTFVSVCNLIKEGKRSFVEIANILNISNTTVSRYLKSACSTGYLNMNYNDLKKQSLKIGNMKTKNISDNKITGYNRMPVKCIETGEIFKSMNDADLKYGGCVSSYLSGRIKYTGHLEDGTQLHWERI